MNIEGKPFTIAYPLPVTIHSAEKEITLTNEIKLIRYSLEELEQIWGAYIDNRAEGEQTQRQVVVTNAKAQFLNFINGLGSLATVAPQWEWWLIYSPETDSFTSDTQMYAQACIKVCSELLVSFPFSFVYSAAFSRWDFNSISFDRITTMYYDYMKDLPRIEDVESLKTIISKLDADKLETAERLNFAASSFHRRFSADAYVSELVCILEKLYGSSREATYRFRVNIFTANGDLANAPYWQVIHKAYNLRSRYLHGNKPTSKDKLSESEIKDLEKLVSVLLQRYFASTLGEVKSSYNDNVLLTKLES